MDLIKDVNLDAIIYHLTYSKKLQTIGYFN
jgi:hypothetical protein